MAREVSPGGFNYIARNWVVGIRMSLYTFTGFKLFIAWSYRCGRGLHLQQHTLWSLAVLFRVTETWKHLIYFPAILVASLDTNEENCAKMSAPIPAGINVTFPNAAPEKSLATITAGCPVMLPCCSVPTDGTQTVDTTVVGIHTCGLGGRTVCWRKMRRVNAAGNSTVPYCLLGGQALLGGFPFMCCKPPSRASVLHFCSFNFGLRLGSIP